MDIKMIKKGTIGFVALLLVACGGGGGGSGPVYNGVTTQAVVDKNNDKSFTETAYGGSGAGSAFAGVQSNGNSGTSLKNFAKTFRGIVKNFDVSPRNSYPVAAAVPYNNVENGACGGSQTISITMDDQTFDFNGSVTFNNYDDCDGTVNGSVTYSGNFGGGSIGSFKMTFSSLSFTSATESIVMNGEAVFTSIDASTDRIVLNMDYRDNNKNETFRSENLTIDSTDMGTYESAVMSGKVYHPAYGYVVLSTPSPVLTDWNANYPRAGVVVMTGSSSKATVTINDANSYTLTVDEGNNGSIDETSDCTWEPDECTVVP